MELVTAKLQFFPHGGQRKFSGEGGPKEAISEGNGSGLSKSFFQCFKTRIVVFIDDL